MSNQKGGQAAQVVQFLLIAGEAEAWRDSDFFTVTQGSCCKGKNRNPISQLPTWETQVLLLPFQATYPYQLELHICILPTPPGHCPMLEGCKWSPSFVDLGSLTAQQGGGTAQESCTEVPTPRLTWQRERGCPWEPHLALLEGEAKSLFVFLSCTGSSLIALDCFPEKGVIKSEWLQVLYHHEY